jgi:branched-subunit amino acid ABC-type transport system permease component
VLPFIVTGLVTGSLYGLTGVGLVITYRTSGVFNFAHGALAAAAAFIFFGLHTQHHLPWPLAAAITLAIFAVIVGPLMELLTRTLGDAPAAVSIVLTVGGLLFVEGLLLVISHDVVQASPGFLPQSGFTLSQVFVTWADVITAVLALAVAIGLYLYLRVARLGVAMRAVVDNQGLLGLTGVSPVRIRRRAWAIGTVFAALTGILLAPILDLDASLLPLIVVEAFGACAIGLFSSLPLTYVGGLAIGVAEALTTKFLTKPPFTNVGPAVPFVVLIVVLVAVAGHRLPRAGLSVRAIDTRLRSLQRRPAVLLAAASTAVLMAIPFLVGFHLATWTSGLSEFVLFGSLALLVWTSGQISLCQLSFAALGATTMSHMSHDGVPWPLALVIAGLLTVPVGALVAIPAIRLSGVYLALVTFGFGIVMQDVVYPTSLMFGSQLTAPSTRPHIGFINAITSDRWDYYVALAVALVCAAALIAIHRSRFGRLLKGLAQSPAMLESLGLDVYVTRLLVFCVSAFFAAVAGALTVTQFTVSSTTFQPVESLALIAVLAIAAVAGTRLILSAVIASLILAVLPGYVTSFGADQQTLGFGAAAMVGALILGIRAGRSGEGRLALAPGSGRQSKSPVSDRYRAMDIRPTHPEAPSLSAEMASRP